MPPHATSLAEEGVVIAPRFLRAAGETRWDEIRTVLTEGAYPSRAPEENLADLRAALAANLHGAAELRGLSPRDTERARCGNRWRRCVAHAAERMGAALVAFVGAVR